jgi:hypothetical protein
MVSVVCSQHGHTVSTVGYDQEGPHPLSRLVKSIGVARTVRARSASSGSEALLGEGWPNTARIMRAHLPARAVRRRRVTSWARVRAVWIASAAATRDRAKVRQRLDGVEAAALDADIARIWVRREHPGIPESLGLKVMAPPRP